MSEGEQKVENRPPETDLQRQYINSFQQVEEGQLITGQVIEASPEYVFIDVGLKSEGRVPAQEFNQVPEVGSDVQVVLLRKESRSGEVIVSKRRADEKLAWQDLRDAVDQRKPVDGVIRLKIKGGYEVELSAKTRAFVPFSKVDTIRVHDEESYVGLKSQFYVEQLYSKGKVNVVVNRRDWLADQIQKKRDDFYETVHIDDIVKGLVKTFTSFGAFIDLGGFDGLLHINDMRWGHVSSPKEVVNLGDEIEVKVIRIDRDDQKVNLSLKHFSEDPWMTFEDRFQLDNVVKGHVTKLTDFGAFVEVEEGIEGLVHISDLSWVRKVKHPREVLKGADEVEVKILGYDLQKGKLALGLKQVLPNPWDIVPERYPVGRRVTGKVRNLAPFGAFIELEEGIEGLLHVEDMSWTDKVKDPVSVVNVDDEVEVIILQLDSEQRRMRLGLKQLAEDPWTSLSRAYKKGSVIEGVVSSKTDFGVFVRVEGDVEGLISKNHLANPDDKSPEQALGKIKDGDPIKAVVLEINPQGQRLALSVREFLRKSQREDMVKYIQDDSQVDRVSLADIIREKSTN